MKTRDGAAKKVLGKLDEGEREGSILVALSDTLLLTLIFGKLQMKNSERFVEMIGA